MATTATVPPRQLSRRHFLSTATFGAAGLALYGGELERHHIEVTHRTIAVRGLPPSFDGIRLAQLSDIHLDEFTEPYLLQKAVERINRLKPDVVLLTGDYVSFEVLSKPDTIRAAEHCGELLRELTCRERYAILGNHDLLVGAEPVAKAIARNGIPVLRNSLVSLQRGGERIWLAGIDDPVLGRPDLDKTIPASIRRAEGEPVILLCHAPDYVDRVAEHAAADSIALVLSGHTHGGQVRLPFAGPLWLPVGGKKYVEGLFRFGNMQLYVNRGLGAVSLPVRFNCPPEITEFTLRAA